MPTFRQDTKIGGMVPMMKTDDINDQAITKDKIRDGNVTAEKLADGAVSTDKLPDGAIKTPKIADGNITTSKLAEASVVTSKIADQNVTKEKISDQSVDNSKLSPEAVTYDKLKDKSVITEKLNDRAVTTEKVEEKAITNAKLGDQSVDGRVVREASIESKHIGNNAVSTPKIASRSVTNEKIAHNSVSRAELTPDVRNSIDKKADAEQVNNSLYDLEKKIGERFVIEGDVTNLPDEEDLTSVKESERDVLKLADRSYAPYNFSGKGYKILRRNINQVSIAVTKISVESAPSTDGNLYFSINGKETQVAVSATTDNTTALVAQKVASAFQESITEYEISVDTSFITLTRKSVGSVTPSVFSASTTGVLCTITDSTKRKYHNILMPNMINQSNTVYEIRYEFDLGGAEVTIPEGCVLKFEGGKLKNGTLSGNIKFDGNALIENISLSGNFDGVFNPLWIETTDLGEAINIAQTITKYIYISPGVYTFTTPIILNSIKHFNCEGTLKYVGEIINNRAAVTFNNSFNAYIHIKSLELESSVIANMDYSNNRVKNFIGIECSSCYNSSILIDAVFNFNEGVRLDDRNNIPFGYNKIYCNYIFNNNIGIRLYPMTEYGVSENTIYGGRFTHSSLVSYGDIYAIAIGDSELDKDSYREQSFQDIGVGSITLNQCSFEGLKTPIIIKDVNGLIINYCREEQVTKLLTCIGMCTKIVHNIKDNNYFSVSDFSKCSKIGFNYDYFTSKITVNTDINSMLGHIDSSYKSYYPIDCYMFGYNYNDWKQVISNNSLVRGYSGIVGTLIDVSKLENKVIGVKTTNGNKATIYAVFLDENKSVVTPSGWHIPSWTQETVNIKGYSINASNQIIDITNIECAYIFIGISMRSYVTDTLEVYSFSNDAILSHKTAISGDTNPSAFPFGKPFFNTNSMQNNWWNGTKWVDSTGADV